MSKILVQWEHWAKNTVERARKGRSKTARWSSQDLLIDSIVWKVFFRVFQLLGSEQLMLVFWIPSRPAPRSSAAPNNRFSVQHPWLKSKNDFAFLETFQTLNAGPNFATPPFSGLPRCTYKPAKAHWSITSLVTGAQTKAHNIKCVIFLPSLSRAVCIARALVIRAEEEALWIAAASEFWGTAVK